MNQQAAFSEQVPQFVRDKVKFALGRLAEIHEGIKQSVSLEKRVGQTGRYEADALRNRRADIERARATLEEFRNNAQAKGIDADAVIRELGGEPDLTPSPDAQAWLDDPRGPVIGKKHSAPAQEIGLQCRGWAVTCGSNVVAADILKFGFRIEDDVLYPDSIEEIADLLGPGFEIEDQTMPGTTSLKGLPSRSIRVTRVAVAPSPQQYVDDFAVSEQAMAQSAVTSGATDGSPHQQNGSAIEAAIAALELASKTFSASDFSVFQGALNGLAKFRDGVLEHDRRLNAEERAPTGDDYNDLFAMTVLQDGVVIQGMSC